MGGSQNVAGDFSNFLADPGDSVGQSAQLCLGSASIENYSLKLAGKLLKFGVKVLYALH